MWKQLVERIVSKESFDFILFDEWQRYIDWEELTIRFKVVDDNRVRRAGVILVGDGKFVFGDRRCIQRCK